MVHAADAPISTYILATGNENKWREAQRILSSLGSSIALVRQNVDLPELQAATTQQVAIEKVRVAFDSVRAPVIVEDTGFEIEALGGFPGPFIKFWERLGGLASICRAVDGTANRNATAVCVLGVCIRDGTASAIEGRIDGTIAAEPAGAHGFGWDAIFIPRGESRTFAEMTNEEKDRISHRRLAWEILNARMAPSTVV